MSQPIKIEYNGNQIDYPVTVSVSEDYIDYGYRWGTVKKISMQGQLYSAQCDLSSIYRTIVAMQSSIFQTFSNPFQTLTVGGVSIPNCRLESIDFQESNFFGAVSFTINVAGYDDSKFTVAPVVDPIDSISYSEQKNKTIQITRRVSAKGIVTSSNPNAIDSALNYVRSRVGLSGVPQISLITGKYKNILPAGPRKQAEVIDKITGTVSIEQTYILKEGQSSGSVMMYTAESNYNEERGVNTGTIRGSLTGSINTGIDQVRADFKSVNLFGILSSNFQSMGHGGLVNQPENISVNENARENTIDFSYTCISIQNPIRIFEKNFSMQVDYITDKVTVNFNGRVEFRGSQQQRVQNASNFSFSGAQAAGLCQQFYNDNCLPSFGSSATLNNIPITFDLKKDLVNGIVTITASCDNRPIPPNSQFTSFDYVLTADTSIKYHSIAYFLDGQTSLVDYKMKTRGTVSIQGTATAKTTGLTKACEGMAAGLLSQAVEAVGGLDDVLLVESKVDATDKPDDSGYIYSPTITRTGLTKKTPTNWGAGGS
jgi:hypothetical protein